MKAHALNRRRSDATRLNFNSVEIFLAGSERMKTFVNVLDS